MGKKIAVTGVTSYFAQTLLPRLQSDPDIDEIIGIGRRPWAHGYEKLTYVREDIRSERLTELFEGVHTVFHLAFVVGEIHDKNATNDININGSLNVFRAAVAGRVKKVVYTSSATAYGSHKHNGLGLTEETPLQQNRDNYYNGNKIGVERAATEFFEHHPETTLTILRVGLLVGPGIDNMFSRLWQKKLLALPWGSRAHNQMIGEADLGEALYLSFRTDIPGIYNVAADDAVSTEWCFERAGTTVVRLPVFLLKKVADVGFKLRLYPAGGGWVSMSRYSIFCNCDKFKQATGWQPRQSSEDAFLSYLETRKRDARDTPKQAFLTWFYHTPVVSRLALQGLNVLFFLIEKLPLVRDMIPLTSPKKNNITYLPVNSGINGDGAMTVTIEKAVGDAVNEVLPRQVLERFIERANHLVVMDTCICRNAFDCKNFSHEIGCLFMGATALKLPPGLGRRVTKAEAKRHVSRAVGAGLVPLAGKVNVDNLGFLTPDTGRLLSVCFCCHCCCMMGYYKHEPAHLKKLFRPVEGLSVRVTDACRRCGSCIETCIFGAIKMSGGHAVHADHCVGCGRCQRTCPNDAVTISIDNPSVVDDVVRRVGSYVDLSP